MGKVRKSKNKNSNSKKSASVRENTSELEQNLSSLEEPKRFQACEALCEIYINTEPLSTNQRNRNSKSSNSSSSSNSNNGSNGFTLMANAKILGYLSMRLVDVSSRVRYVIIVIILILVYNITNYIFHYDTQM